MAIDFVGLPADVYARLQSQIGERVVGILETTRQDIADAIEKGLAEGLGAAELGDRIEEASAFSELRAETIARTETATLLNQASTESYREFGITHVEVIDGTDDDECAEANGQVWTIEEAQANPIAHPNCVRDFSPFFGEAPEATPTPTEAEPDGVADIRAATERFDGAGGSVETVSAGFRNSAELRNEFGDMASRMPEGWAMEPGPHAVNSVFRIQGSTQEYQIARTADGSLAGAMKLSPPSMLNPEALEISLVGSTGIAPGAGSAMVRDAIHQAADQGVGIRLTPLTDAKPFWTRMGMGEGNADNGGWGASAAQVAQMSKALKP